MLLHGAIGLEFSHSHGSRSSGDLYHLWGNWQFGRPPLQLLQNAVPIRWGKLILLIKHQDDGLSRRHSLAQELIG